MTMVLPFILEAGGGVIDGDVFEDGAWVGLVFDGGGRG